MYVFSHPFHFGEQEKPMRGYFLGGGCPQGDLSWWVVSATEMVVPAMQANLSPMGIRLIRNSMVFLPPRMHIR